VPPENQEVVLTTVRVLTPMNDTVVSVCLEVPELVDVVVESERGIVAYVVVRVV